MIIADTGAIIALLDRDDRHHQTLRTLFEERPEVWVLPWAILAEVDYLAQTQLGAHVQRAFLGDLASGGYRVDWGMESDLRRARDVCNQYRDLALGLVDAVVIAVAERRRAEAIATLDLRHFAVVRIAAEPKLYPRDLPPRRAGGRRRAARSRP